MPSMPSEPAKDNTFAIIGDEDVVSGFAALGFKVYSFRGFTQFEQDLDELVANKAGVCLVQDNLYEQGREKINSYNKLPLPIFIPFAKDAKIDLLEDLVRDLRVRATGAL